MFGIRRQQNENLSLIHQPSFQKRMHLFEYRLQVILLPLPCLSRFEKSGKYWNHPISPPTPLPGWSLPSPVPPHPFPLYFCLTLVPHRLWYPAASWKCHCLRCLPYHCLQETHRCFGDQLQVCSPYPQLYYQCRCHLPKASKDCLSALDLICRYFPVPPDLRCFLPRL